jgi:hypothetical protein
MIVVHADFFCFQFQYADIISTKTFCCRRRSLAETFCDKDVFAWRHFFEETFCVETFCMCAVTVNFKVNAR